VKHNFEKLQVWDKAHKLVLDIYTITKHFPPIERYGLTSQIRRSVVSIPSNIAEGTGRNSDKEFQRFLDYAIGSLFELETQITLANDLNFLSQEEYKKIHSEIKSLIRMIIKFKTILEV